MGTDLVQSDADRTDAQNHLHQAVARIMESVSHPIDDIRADLQRRQDQQRVGEGYEPSRRRLAREVEQALGQNHIEHRLQRHDALDLFDNRRNGAVSPLCQTSHESVAAPRH